MTPEEQHKRYMQDCIDNEVKAGKNMALVRFTLFHKYVPLNFKIHIQIWQDDDWDYLGHLEYCKKLVETSLELNTSSYKAMSDQLYRLIANEMPGREVWIEINTDDFGLTTLYNQ